MVVVFLSTAGNGNVNIFDSILAHNDGADVVGGIFMLIALANLMILPIVRSWSIIRSIAALMVVVVIYLCVTYLATSVTITGTTIMHNVAANRVVV